jgi:streptogramin lyase
MFCRTSSCFLIALSALAVLAFPARAFGQQLFVASGGTKDVKQYNGTTGAFTKNFVTAGSGGLVETSGITFGPDGNLYVTDDVTGTVKRYNGTTGAYIGDFGSGLTTPGQLIFGPDGNLYVSSRDSIARFNGTTGASLGAITGGGLSICEGVAFAPDGDLLAASVSAPGVGPGTIKEYNPTTGAYLGDFVPQNSGGLLNPLEMKFGKDGNLYVSDAIYSGVKRYNGITGAFIDNFVTSGSGGLNAPIGMDFGPDGNLYVYDRGTDSVLRYNGSSGAFIDNFASGGGLSTGNFITFGPSSATSSTPEPGAYALFGSLVLSGMALLRRKRAA